MPTDRIIDGYNLLHAAGMAQRSFGKGGLQRARERLLRRISRHLTVVERSRTVVVFDAKAAPPDAPSEAVAFGMHIVYALGDAEADDRIEALVAAHPVPRELAVISSDHRLHRAARRRGAVAYDSDQFLDELDRRAAKAARGEPEPLAPVASDPKETGEIPPAELETWLREFGGVDVQSLADVERPARPAIEPLPGGPSPAPRREPPATPSSTPPPRPPTPRSGGRSSPQSQPPSRSQPRDDGPQDVPPTLPPEESTLAADLDFWERRIRELESDV